MSTNQPFSSLLGITISRYLALKQALGREYANEQRILQHLDSFLDNIQSDLTAETFAQWCHTRRHLVSGVRRNWMRNVRNLCLYRRRTEPSCFVPDPTQFPALHQPVQPHIFTETEIIRLLNAIKQLKPGTGSPLRQENIQLALVLLYTTGLRRGELIKLRIGDYNPIEHTLLIRESKFHKSRIIVLSGDGWNEVENYLNIRRGHQLPVSTDQPLFWNRHTKAGFYSGTGIRSSFQLLFDKANIRTANGRLPRLHDFRHSFAINALLRWYREGADVQSKLPLLSIYMGHVSIVSTQYYLRFIDEVVGCASELFANRYSALVTDLDQGGNV